MENTLKQKLAAGARPIGTFFDTASVSLMECLGRTGLDFAIIDNEHSPIEAETTAALVRAAELSGICPLARVREIVEQYDFTRDRLAVELTEDSYAHDRETALRTIEGLHAMGLRIVLDDIGAGYSSLSDLSTYPIDGVKIDFPDKWVHLRKSNTEPIIRVYSEAATMEEADALGKKLMQVVYDMQ